MIKRINGSSENSTGTGFLILSKELFMNSKPTNITKNATIRPEIYSIRQCPKGCSLSAGLLESLKPKMVTNEAPTSERLLKASAITAILLTKSPAVILIKNKTRFTKIPTTPPRYP